MPEIVLNEDNILNGSFDLLDFGETDASGVGSIFATVKNALGRTIVRITFTPRDPDLYVVDAPNILLIGLQGTLQLEFRPPATRFDPLDSVIDMKVVIG